jgi:ribosomal protein S18 acetylase RimI-like enzyme
MGCNESITSPGDGAITLRPATADDEAFLCTVYAATRADELALLNWDQAQKDAFLTMQFTAQHRHYHTYYADADFQLVLLSGRPIGRLYVARLADHILLIDIALLPDYRNAGIGSVLLTDVLAEAEQVGKPVRLHVEPWNRARRLYERLGFRRIAEQGFYWLMEWPPPGAGDTP